MKNTTKPPTFFVQSEREHFLMEKLSLLEDEISRNTKDIEVISKRQKNIQKQHFNQERNTNTLKNESLYNFLTSQKIQILSIKCEISEIKTTFLSIPSKFRQNFESAKSKILIQFNDQIQNYKRNILLEKQEILRLKNEINIIKQQNKDSISKTKKRQIQTLLNSDDDFDEIKNELDLHHHSLSPSIPKRTKSYNLTSPNTPNIQMTKNGPNLTSPIFSNGQMIDSEKEMKMKKKIKHQNAKIKELEYSLLSKDSIISSCEKSIKILENDKDIPHVINELIIEVDSKDKEITNLKNKLDKYSKSMIEINSFKKDYELKTQKNDELKNLLIKEKKNKEKLENDNLMLNQRISKYENQIGDFKKEIKSLQDDFNHSLLINDCKDKNIKKLNIQIENLTKQNHENEEKLIEYTTTAKIHKEQFDDLYNELDKAKKSNTILKFDLKRKQTQINKLTIKLNELLSQQKTCIVCNETISQDELVILKDNFYHKKCVKCMSCENPFNLPEQLDEIVIVNSTTFLCKKHYEQYVESDDMSEELQKEYEVKTKENIVNVLFDNNNFFSKNEIANQSSENIFISDELVKDSYQINKPYDYIVPTGKLHLEISAEEIDFESLNQCLGKELSIIAVEKGSTLLTLAFLGMNNVDVEKEFKLVFDKCKENIKNTLGDTIVGNLVKDESIFSNPNKIKDLYQKPSVNILQNTKFIDEINFDEIKEKIINKLSNEKNDNWKFIFAHQTLFDDFENKIKEDIEKSAIELIIVGETVIANKYLHKIKEIKEKIPQNDVGEFFVYHGSRLNNHMKIVQKHFLSPKKNKTEKTDDGYYGKGIYATDNLFYASIYGNGYNVLKTKEITYIIACTAIYNKSEVQEITDNKFYGQDIPPNTADKYGIHKALVGNTTGFWPIEQEAIEQNVIVANEYVFPKKYQICPILSLMVMRTDHFILWKDDHIDNEENEEHFQKAFQYMEKVSKLAEVNFYKARNNKEALNIVKLKKRNRIKLITNGGEDCNGKDLINQIRKITGSDFICLVFARSLDHSKWVTEMKNVLLTNNPEDFQRFVGLQLKKKDILDFVHDLQDELHFVKFNINEEELLNFPLVDEIDNLDF